MSVWAGLYFLLTLIIVIKIWWRVYSAISDDYYVKNSQPNCEKI